MDGDGVTLERWQQGIFEHIQYLDRRRFERERQADVEALRKAFYCLGVSYIYSFDAYDRLQNLRKYLIRDRYSHLSRLDARFYSYGSILALIPLGRTHGIPDWCMDDYRYAVEHILNREPLSQT